MGVYRDISITVEDVKLYVGDIVGTDEVIPTVTR